MCCEDILIMKKQNYNKIFFAGSIRGGRQLIPTYQYIIRFLKSRNFTVISEHVAAEGLEKVEAKMTEQEIYEKDVNWVEESDCVVAEITVPSVGVGYEICHAARHKKPVLCLYETGANASAMVLGNTTGYVTSSSYSDKKQLEEIILEFLEKKE
jgi:nucleoside 2-deoxyribosyltransferase